MTNETSCKEKRIRIDYRGKSGLFIEDSGFYLHERGKMYRYDSTEEIERYLTQSSDGRVPQIEIWCFNSTSEEMAQIGRWKQGLLEKLKQKQHNA